MAVQSARQSKTLADHGDYMAAAKKGKEARKMAVHGICLCTMFSAIVAIILVYIYVYVRQQ